MKLLEDEMLISLKKPKEDVQSMIKARLDAK